MSLPLAHVLLSGGAEPRGAWAEQAELGGLLGWQLRAPSRASPQPVRLPSGQDRLRACGSCQPALPPEVTVAHLLCSV